MTTQTVTQRSTDVRGAVGPTIVVGWDGSAASRIAMGVAARLARHGDLIAVHAHTPSSSHPTTRWQELLQGDAAERSMALLETIPGAGIQGLELLHVEARSLDGTPVEALLRAARDSGAEAIAVGSRGIGESTAPLGSVSAELLTVADRPVLIVPPAAVHPDHGT